MTVQTRTGSRIILAYVLCATLATASTPPEKPSFRPMSQRAASLVANDYVEIAIADNGQFTIGTKKGDPARSSDDNKKLLYGHPTPWSSYTTLWIDGGILPLKAVAPSSGPAISGTSARCVWNQLGVQVMQVLSIVKSKGTKYKDTVEIAYTIRNTGVVDRRVGLRIMLDTMLGDNDGAPFRVPGVGKVTSDHDFYLSSAPYFAQVFDNLSDPAVISILSFRGLRCAEPDRVTFGAWGQANSIPWEYAPSTYTFSDSAVMVWWGYRPEGIVTLAPQEEVTFLMLYGLGGISFVTWKPFNIGVAGPAELELLPEGTGYRYLPDPFIVTAYLENTAGATVSGARAALNLPPELFFAPGESAVKPVPPVPAGGDTQVSWYVRTFGKHNGERLYSVTVDADGDAKTVPRAVTVPGSAGCAFGRVTDNRNNPLPGARLELVRGGAVLGTVTARDNGTYLFGGLAPGRYDVRAVRDSFIAAMAPAEVTGDDDTSAGTHFALLTPPAPSAIESFPYPNPVREGDAHIAYHLAAAGRATVRIFTPDGILLEETAVDNAQTGWNEFRWDSNGRANGVYYYVVESGGAMARGKIAVAKWNRP